MKDWLDKKIHRIRFGYYTWRESLRGVGARTVMIANAKKWGAILGAFAVLVALSVLLVKMLQRSGSQGIDPNPVTITAQPTPQQTAAPASQTKEPANTPAISPSPVVTPTPVLTPTPLPTPTASPTPKPTPRVTPTPSPQLTVTPEITPTPEPTRTPTPTPTPNGETPSPTTTVDGGFGPRD